MFRYLIGFFVTIGLIVLLIVLLFGGGSGKPDKKVMMSGKALSSYATTDAQVRLTIDGPINDVQDHRQTQITVDRHSATYNLLQGYDGAVIKTQTTANTDSGYAAFLHSLELLNFAKGNTSDASLKSEAGHCATGRRYIYELIENGKDVQRFWSTSCGGPHSYLGNASNTIELFERQIPGYDTSFYNDNF